MCPVSDPALFSSLVDHPGMLVMGVDVEGRVMWRSRGMEQLTGYTFDEIKGKNWVTTLVPEEHQNEALRLCRGRLGGDRSADCAVDPDNVLIRCPRRRLECTNGSHTQAIARNQTSKRHRADIRDCSR